MEDKTRQILNQEFLGTPIVEIARVLELTVSTVNYHRNKPDYQEELQRLKDDVYSRSSMTLQQRTEAMLTKVVQAMEEEMDKAATNDRIIGLTDKLKDLIQVVGKPDQQRRMGIVQTPGLLTREAFNRGDGEESSPAAQPSPIPLSEFGSLGSSTSVKETLCPLGSGELPGGYETPIRERDPKSYPQVEDGYRHLYTGTGTGELNDGLDDDNPELETEELPDEWNTGVDPLDEIF
jgi:hypothetical protein